MRDSRTERTRAVAQDFLARLADGDPHRIGEVFAEHLDWHIADNPAVPWIRPRATRGDAVAHFAELAAHTVPEKATAEVTTLIVEDGEAVVTGRLGGTVRATGTAFRSPFAVWMTVEDGLITGFRVYEDSLAVALACTPDGPPHRASDSFKTLGRAPE
ncbi:nuclear transport factor 2 family protein [Streptomyces sp. ACA25]|uniref:nuclear transport factor 2 family protein n=1 Tax=Streptomyces sp. ACA25 TaxID=3022596 RepID=UPI002306F7C3|nr:nuclear transport factor 2 family protein [Streptomyces sp. ACA25]MDB1086222.1 nuclear transport factor 2 family protein [Streptomyces sp. ACA25]